MRFPYRIQVLTILHFCFESNFSQQESRKTSYFAAVHPGITNGIAASAMRRGASPVRAANGSENNQQDEFLPTAEQGGGGKCFFSREAHSPR